MPDSFSNCKRSSDSSRTQNTNCNGGVLDQKIAYTTQPLRLLQYVSGLAHLSATADGTEKL